MMENKILIAYSSKAGSTAEVAEAIAEVIQQEGVKVDLQPVEEVHDLSGYDAVVLGSAVRVFRILGKTRKFLRKHRRQLKRLPVAYFLVCLTMSEKTPENITKAKAFAKPMINTKEPVSLGLFGGCLDPDKLSGFFAMPFKDQPKEDHRDWDEIRAWGKEILPKLLDRS